MLAWATFLLGLASFITLLSIDANAARILRELRRRR